MFVPIHKLRYLSCVRPFCGAEQSASYVFILYTYWRKISIQNSMGHPDRCGFLLFSHKICRIRTAHTANEMCMKFSCTISGCPAGARKWHISYFATLCIAKKEHHPDGWCFYLERVDKKDAGAKSCVARVCGLLRLDFPFCNSNPQHLVMTDE